MLCILVLKYIRCFPQVTLKRIHPNVYLLCTLLIADYSNAQTSLPLQFESLTINNGLSQGFVSSITQDKKGLMWFATSDGLNKYDGYTFNVYHHDPDDITSLASDDLTGVIEDSKERLWVITRHNGIDLFDRENNVFIHLRHSTANSLRSNNIISMTEDKSGALWIRTDLGIDRLEINEALQSSTDSKPTSFLDKKLIFTHIDLEPISESLKNSYATPYIFVDSRNHILLSTSNDIWEINYNAGHVYQFIKRFKFPVIDADHLPALIEDTVNDDLYVNNGTVFKIHQYNFNAPEALKHNAVSQAAWTIDKHHRLWLKDSNKIVQINLQSSTMRYVYPADSVHIQWLNTSTDYFTDRTGVIWIITGGYGILKYYPEVERFHHILPKLNTYQLLETAPGKIITNNLLTITIKKDSPVSSAGLVNNDSAKKYLPKYMILSLAKDTNGNYWIAEHAGLIRYNIKTKRFRRFSLPVTNKSSLPFPLYADKSNNLWMGYNRYFIRFNISSGRFMKFEYPLSLKSYEYDFLQCIYEENNTLWLGSINGLFRFNTINNSIQHYSYHQADANSLSNDVILSLYNDMHQPSSYLWVGTKGGGLNRLDKITGKFTRYSTKNGLANNVVYGILPDDDGDLWLSTNNGLSEFNTVTEKFRNFDVSDGLQSNEFNRYAFCKTSDGLLVFGGLNGINYFDPADIQPLDPPEVVLTDFRLFNKKVDLKNLLSPLTKEIRFVKQIQLAYEQNVITFQFAAMDYRKSGNAVYRYKMENFDKDWIYSGRIREATYTNLDPGVYRFVVQGTFENGMWGARETFLKVIVIAPWYRTWWFYFLLFTVTVSVTYALYRYRLSQLNKLEMLRNRIARDLHDEVGSSISTIAIYSKIVHEHLGSASFNNDSLMKKITENAQEIMESMTDIVWNINSKNDAFEHIISRMREHAHQLLEAKGYEIHFNFDENLFKTKLQMEKRRDFYLIYKEAMNNIAKYANGTKVWITLVTHNTSINLTIKDNGKGFDMNAVRKSSNGLNNMNFRAATLNGKIKITSAPGEGTEIRVSF